MPPEIYKLLAAIYESEGEPGKALEYWKKYALARPRDEEAKKRIAELAEKLGVKPGVKPGGEPKTAVTDFSKRRSSPLKNPLRNSQIRSSISIGARGAVVCSGKELSTTRRKCSHRLHGPTWGLPQFSAKITPWGSL